MSDELAPTSDGYRLRGLPLTPTGVQELILEIFSGKTVERHQIVAAVEQTHSERGGAASRANITNTVMKALAALRDSGRADNPAHGFWRLTNGQSAPKLPDTPELPLLEPEVSPQAEVTLGTGESSVYLYYYPTYRRDAEHNGQKTWPCKIGRSDRDPMNRIYSQASTALPEGPAIGLLLRTSLPSQWEHVLHGILALRGRIVEDAPGDEWFNTSPAEIVELILYIDPGLKAAEPLPGLESQEGAPRTGLNNSSFP